MNVEIGTEAAQFPEKEYINGVFLAVQFSSIYVPTTFHNVNKLLNDIFPIALSLQPVARPVLL
jgi:hypothetical protein